jgi:hypothetical protein
MHSGLSARSHASSIQNLEGAQPLIVKSLVGIIRVRGNVTRYIIDFTLKIKLRATKTPPNSILIQEQVVPPED